MSKTFKSVATSRTITVEGFFNGAFSVVFSDNSSRDLMLQGDDAPALALAILEAAGADSDLTWSGAKDYGNADHLGWIAGHLGAYIKTQERATAEAKEQAELEAEAFKLRRAYLEGRAGFDSWNELTDAERDHWLAVARKAREMRKS